MPTISRRGLLTLIGGLAAGRASGVTVSGTATAAALPPSHWEEPFWGDDWVKTRVGRPGDRLFIVELDELPELTVLQGGDALVRVTASSTVEVKLTWVHSPRDTHVRAVRVDGVEIALDSVSPSTLRLDRPPV
jgi:hypothetical protein